MVDWLTTGPVQLHIPHCLLKMIAQVYHEHCLLQLQMFEVVNKDSWPLSKHQAFSKQSYLYQKIVEKAGHYHHT